MPGTNYILEYNESQGQFHFNSGHLVPDIGGWVTICRSISYSQCLEFVEYIETNYPSARCGSGQVDYPDLDCIKREFIAFLLS